LLLAVAALAQMLVGVLEQVDFNFFQLGMLLGLLIPLPLALAVLEEALPPTV
jgi:hypothetical protein